MMAAVDQLERVAEEVRLIFARFVGRRVHAPESGRRAGTQAVDREVRSSRGHTCHGIDRWNRFDGASVHAKDAVAFKVFARIQDSIWASVAARRIDEIVEAE